ncbi:Fic family protein [Erysipelotrichaceae bacterium OttesenSCG-928-M19]|nr:Fic family protein [Erysipelotrichaceae bacterium OttesenSCG-928-M19]
MITPFSITSNMLNLIIEISQKLTELELEKERNLLLRRNNRIYSIQSSLAIENNTLSIEQVTNIINGKKIIGAPKEICEVKNAYEAYELAFKMDPYSIDDFLTIHKLITKDLVEESGSFRNKDVGVYDESGRVVHIGARPQYINKLVSELFECLKNDEMPELIKSCLIHFEIEMIHPFEDGNGRMGRLWQNLILAKWHSIFEWIPVETIVYENQLKYYEMLSIGNKENNATMFIEFMLEAIHEIVTKYCIDKNSDNGKLSLSDKLTSKELAFFYEIYPFLKDNNEISNSKAAQLSGRSPSTIRRYLSKFVSLGILSAKGVNKNRKYLLIEEKPRS